MKKSDLRHIGLYLGTAAR